MDINLPDTNKIAKDILATKPDDVFVYPGKPGYVAVAEYFKKEKKVTLTLHKFDF